MKDDLGMDKKRMDDSTMGIRSLGIIVLQTDVLRLGLDLTAALRNHI